MSSSLPFGVSTGEADLRAEPVVQVPLESELVPAAQAVWSGATKKKEHGGSSCFSRVRHRRPGVVPVELEIPKLLCRRYRHGGDARHDRVLGSGCVEPHHLAGRG